MCYNSMCCIVLPQLSEQVDSHNILYRNSAVSDFISDSFISETFLLEIHEQ